MRDDTGVMMHHAYLQCEFAETVDVITLDTGAEIRFTSRAQAVGIRTARTGPTS